MIELSSRLDKKTPQTNSRGYGRDGLAALYAFTPYKIIYTTPRDGVVITFWYPKNAIGLFKEGVDESFLSKSLSEVIRSSERLTKLWTEKRFEIGERVRIYRKFPAFEFTQCSEKDKNCKYVLIINKTLYNYYRGRESEDSIKEAIKKAYKTSSFVLAEYSYNSINQPSFCRSGLVLITHRSACPLANVCPYKSGKSRYNCSHFTTSVVSGETYAGIYKVAADIEVEVSKLEEHGVIVEKPLIVIPYKGYPFISIELVDPVNILAYYRAVNFLPKNYRVNRAIRAEFGKTIGIRLYLTTALKIEFKDTVLKEIVMEFLNNKDVGAWLRFKSYMLMESRAVPGISSTRRKNILRPWLISRNQLCPNDDSYKHELRRVFDLIIDEDSEYGLAAEFVIVHTIVHMLLLRLWSLLGLSENELSYVITYDKNTFVAWVFEASSGGYGYLKHIAEDVEKLHEIVMGAFENSYEETCVVNIGEDFFENMKNLANSICDELKNNMPRTTSQKKRKLDKSCHQLEKLLEKIDYIHGKYGIHPHVYTINECFSKIVPGALREHFGKLLSKLDISFNTFDGVIGHYYLEDGCMMSFFLQPFSVSCSAASLVSKGVHEQPSEKRLKKYVLEWVKTVKSGIDITTWSMSIHDFDELLASMRKVCEKGAKIRILLGNKDENAAKSVEALYSKLGEKCVEVRLYSETPLHKKALIIDGSTLIWGSFNLTKSGLTSNIESINIVNKPSIVEKEAREFEELWQKARPVKSPSDLK